MKSRITVPSGLLLAVLVTTLGCATAQSWNPFSKTAVPAPVVQSDAKSEPKVVEPPAEKVVDVAAPHAPVVEAAKQDEENSFTAAFRKAGTAISSVFRSESDNGLQGDPTSLTNLPKKIDATVYEKAAEVLEKRGDFTGALEQYEKGLEVEPNHSLMLVKQARLLTRLGEYELAEKSYQRAIQAASDEVLPVHDLGLFYAERGRVDAALTMLAMAVKLAPENPRYRNNLARVLIDVDRVDDAVSQLEAVLSPAKARYNAGYLLRERKAYQQARTQLQQAIKLDPSFEEAKHLLADLPAANQFTSAPAPKSDSDTGKGGSDVETDSDSTKSGSAEASIQDQSAKSHDKGETSERKTDEIGLEFPQSIGQTERPPAPPAPAPSPKDVQP
ncbi:MAG: tetratricopeptide repeat protein [Planctomycetota bacterium]|nr:tetratricopeptide repeat protein [Planctomycetota bacterium]